MNHITLEGNTFAEACYNMNSIEELQAILDCEADPSDMKTWELTESEYFEQVKLALAALTQDEVD